MAIASRTKRAGTVGREWKILKSISVVIKVLVTKFHGRPGEHGDMQIGQTVHHSSTIRLLRPWLTWNKEHDPSSKWAVEPLKSREVGKGEDSRDDASKARHGREDHESTSGIPVGWGGAEQGREQLKDVGNKISKEWWSFHLAWAVSHQNALVFLLTHKTQTQMFYSTFVLHANWSDAQLDWHSSHH